MVRSTSRCRRLAALLAVALLPAFPAAWADPSDFVFEPYAAPGRYALQYTGGTERDRDGTHGQSHTLALATSPTERWFTAGYVGWQGQSGESLHFDEVTWVNHLSLSPASSPAGLGLYAEVARPHDRSEGYGITWGPTLQYDAAHLQANLNVWWHKQVRAQDAGPATLNYQWQVKSLLRPRVELGVQGFGDVGPWTHWSARSQQQHQVGPAAFFAVPAGDRHVVRLDTAVLAGLTHESPRYTWRLRSYVAF